MCTVLLPPGGNPTAVNKYTITYMIQFHTHDDDEDDDKFRSVHHSILGTTFRLLVGFQGRNRYVLVTDINKSFICLSHLYISSSTHLPGSTSGDLLKIKMTTRISVEFGLTYHRTNSALKVSENNACSRCD